MKFIKNIAVVLLICSCASVRVDYDFDRKTDFSEYKTYNYYSDLETGLTALDSKRLLNVFDDVMNAKGLSLSESPDFYVNIQSSEYESHQQNTVGVGIGGSGRNVGGGISVGIPLDQSKMSRQIIFDFIDEDGKGLFWQAVSESSYNMNVSPDQREANLRAIVEKVLNGYPPNQ